LSKFSNEEMKELPASGVRQFPTLIDLGKLWHHEFA
jgi:hypothetical protein